MKAVVCLLVAACLLSGQNVKPHIKAALAAFEEGKAAQRNQEVQRGIDSFRRAIEIEPTFLDAYQALIRLYLESGRRLEAAASMTQFLEIQPGAIEYRILLGNILLEQKQAEKALAQFSLALERDSYNADALLGFAAAARQNGMEDRAKEAIALGREHHPLDERFKREPGSVNRP